MSEKRPRVRIRFRYNKETGEIEEFIIDDQAPAAPEAYHDKVARAIAGRLGRAPQIEDAGGQYGMPGPQVVETPVVEEEEGEKPLEETTQSS